MNICNIKAKDGMLSEIKIQPPEKLKCGDWQEYAANHTEATIYHTPAWSRILKTVFGFKCHHLFAVNADRIVGFLPLYTRTCRVLDSSPLRDRGGLLADSYQIEDLLLQYAREKVEKLGCRYSIIKQLKELHHYNFEHNGYGECYYLIRSLIGLPNNEDIYWKKLNSKVKGKIRQARKHSLSFEVASDPNSFMEFYEMFWRNRRKLGVPSYSAKFFAKIAEEFIPQKLARLFFVVRRKERLAGMIVFTYRDTVIDAYSASKTERLQLRPNDYLKWQAIRWAIENQYKFFDLGADTPYLKSLLQFKKKWIVSQQSIPYYFYSRNKRTPNIDPAGHLPKFLSENIIPCLPKYFFKQFSRLSTFMLLRSL